MNCLCVFTYFYAFHVLKCITGEVFAEVSISSCLGVSRCKECTESARCALTEVRQPQEISRGIGLNLHQQRCKECIGKNSVSSSEEDRTTEGSVEALPGGH
jgi:hypothetical protein